MPACSFPRRLAAGIVKRQSDALHRTLLVGDQQVAHPGLGVVAFGGNDLDVGRNGWQALEVLERLFDVPELEQVARSGRHGVSLGHARIGAVGKADCADPARNHGQRQGACVQVLWRNQDAGRHIALGDDRVLHAFHHHAHRLGTEATAGGGVGFGVGGLQRPAKATGVIAVEHDAVDAETRRFVGRKRFRRCRLWCLQTHVWRLLLLLTQRALAILLAPQLLPRRTGLRHRQRPRRERQCHAEPLPATTRVALHPWTAHFRCAPAPFEPNDNIEQVRTPFPPAGAMPHWQEQHDRCGPERGPC